MKTIIIIVALTAVALVGFGAVYSLVNANNSGVSIATSLDSASLTATISGQVNYPGTYVLSPGATLLDLITAAQGVNGNADSLAFNTDYVLENKGSYYIAPLFDNGDTCAVSPITKTNVNIDDSDTMQAVAGFSKTVANAIVSYRASATFKAIEEIKLVSGIGSATFEKVKDKITLRSA